MPLPPHETVTVVVCSQRFPDRSKASALANRYSFPASIFRYPFCRFALRFGFTFGKGLLLPFILPLLLRVRRGDLGDEEGLGTGVMLHRPCSG